MIDIRYDYGASQEMVQLGQSQIAEIDAAIADLTARIAALNDQATAAVQAAQDRTAALDVQQAKMRQAEAEYNQAAGYAKLAHKTANEKQAIETAAKAKKTHQTATKEYERQAHAHADAESAAQASAADIEQQIHLLRFEIETREAERQAVLRGSSQALNEVGKHRHAQIVEEYQSKAAAVEAIREQLLAAQIDLADFHRASVESLVHWPDLRKDVATLQPMDDPTVRIFQAAMFYIAVLAQDVTQLDATWPASVWSIRNALVIPEGMYNMPGGLREKHAELQRLLDEYLAFKAGQ